MAFLNEITHAFGTPGDLPSTSGGGPCAPLYASLEQTGINVAVTAGGVLRAEATTSLGLSAVESPRDRIVSTGHRNVIKLVAASGMQSDLDAVVFALVGVGDKGVAIAIHPVTLGVALGLWNGGWSQQTAYSSSGAIADANPIGKWFSLRRASGTAWIAEVGPSETGPWTAIGAPSSGTGAITADVAMDADHMGFLLFHKHGAGGYVEWDGLNSPAVAGGGGSAPADLVLASSSAARTITQGDTSFAPVSVALSNGGDDPLGALSVAQISGPTGAVAAAVDSDSLDLTADTGLAGLAQGTPALVFRVTSADGGTEDFTLTLTVGAPAPGVGETFQIVATPKRSDGATLSRSKAYASSNTAVATVNSSGLIQAVDPGTCIITVTSGGVARTIAVTVTAP